MKSIYNIEQFTKDRDEALLSLDKEKILAFYAKYGLPYAKKIKSFGQQFTNAYTTSKQVQKNKKQKLNNGFCKTALQLKYRKEKSK